MRAFSPDLRQRVLAACSAWMTTRFDAGNGSGERPDRSNLAPTLAGPRSFARSTWRPSAPN